MPFAELVAAVAGAMDELSVMEKPAEVSLGTADGAAEEVLFMVYKAATFTAERAHRGLLHGR